MKKIRRLRADEIECRVAQTGNNNGQRWCTILLYKDARVDQRILDETFGIMGWKRSHELIGDRLYCTVSIWDAEKSEWISKQDVGTESYTEREKGQASDAFKRACFNIGIGRELYTAPKIFINLGEGEYSEKDSKTYPKISIDVKSIDYDDSGNITTLVLVDKKGNVRYSTGGNQQPRPKSNPVPPAQPIPPTPPPASEQPAKRAMSDKQLEKTIERINNGELDLLDKSKAQFALKDSQIHAMSEAITNYKINNNIL